MYVTETGKQIIPDNPPENPPVVIPSPELAAEQSKNSSKTLEQVTAELEELKARVNNPPPAQTVVTAVETAPARAATVADMIPPGAEAEAVPPPQAVTTDAPPPENPDKPNPPLASKNLFKKLFLG